MQKNEIVILAYTQRAASLACRTGRLLSSGMPEGCRIRIALHREHAAGVREPEYGAFDVISFSQTEEVLEPVWSRAALILYIAAAGIAVRTIAPYVKDKLSDPPVLCMDENARYVIPLLSGHVGGANAWAERISELTGAEAVITTATDARSLFAVDLFAKEHGLLIRNREEIKRVSGALLAGEEVGWFCGEQIPWDICRTVPDGFTACGEADGTPRPKTGVTITSDEELPEQFANECRMLPKNLCIGIGCKKDCSPDTLMKQLRRVLKDAHLSERRICLVASIERKKDEAAILQAAEAFGVPFLTYTAEELASVKGDFSPSAFVEEQVGVDNVCERSAVAAAGPGARLIVGKTASEGTTFAVAERR